MNVFQRAALAVKNKLAPGGEHPGGTVARVIQTILGGDAFTTDASGNATITPALKVLAGLLGLSPTLGIGYGTGAGGAVTQITSITTGVTLNKVCGAITTVSSTLAAGVDAQFTLTNSTIAANDVVVASVKSYGGTADGIPVAKVVATAAGSCVINVHNQGAVTLDALMVINFAVIKGVAA